MASDRLGLMDRSRNAASSSGFAAEGFGQSGASSGLGDGRGWRATRSVLGQPHRAFLADIWPKSRKLASPAIADELSRLCIASRSRFPDALSAVRAWLQPIPYPNYIVHSLHESKLCPQFPAEALTLLDALIDDQLWPPREFEQCLDEIEAAKPDLAHDPRFTQLQDYWRRHGRG